jgi:hypothetical protein
MIKVRQSRLDYCANSGNFYEELFYKKVIAKGFDYRKSTNKEDWYMHIDCYVNGYGVDIKGNRHLETIWLEYTNVNGNSGWLRGKAFYIAMFIVELNSFSIYKRTDLLNYIKQNTKEKTNNKKDYLKLYTRNKWGKKDEIIKVKYNHIKHLELIKL